MTITLTINGVSMVYVRGTLEITETINSRNFLRITVFSLDGSYRPTLRHEIIVVADGTRIFGGTINDWQETGIGGESAGPGLQYNITATDFNELASRQVMNTILPSANIKTNLTNAVIPVLSAYGVTLHGSQADGPTLPILTCPWMYFNDFLTNITALAADLVVTPQAYVWEIDYNKVLRVYGVLEAGHTAPFNLTTTTAPASIIGDVTIRPSRTDYATFIWLLFGTGQKSVIDHVGTGAGVQTVFALHYYMVEHLSYVNVGGTISGETIVGGVNETLGAAGSGATWIYDTATATVTRTSAPTGAILVPYKAGFPWQVNASSGAVGANVVVKVHSREDVFDYVVAQSLCNTILAQSLNAVIEVYYASRVGGCHPGQTQTITLPKHGLTGSYLLTQVNIHDRAETELQYDITAIGGIETLPEAWWATYQLWAQSSGASTVMGTSTPVGSSNARQTFYLGGNSTIYVQSPSPDWVAADAVRVTIDSGVRGTTLGTVRLRLRAASGNVTARLRNLTDSTTAGTSSVVSTSAWTDTSFQVTLALGAKVYELQLLPSVANVDVAGVGYFE